MAARRKTNGRGSNRRPTGSTRRGTKDQSDQVRDETELELEDLEDLADDQDVAADPIDAQDEPEEDDLPEDPEPDDEDLDTGDPDDEDVDADPDEDAAPVKSRSRRSASEETPSRETLAGKLYSGKISFPFMRRSPIFYAISALIIVASLVTVSIRGFNFGIEFLGGADFQVTTTVKDDTVSTFTDAVSATGLPDLTEITVRTIGDNRVRIQTRTLETTTEVPTVQAAIAEAAGVDPGDVAYSLIGASWGGQITQQAITALIVFLALVSVVIAVYFRNWKMSVAAMAALVHDLVLTVGIYAAVGFAITPASVIGILTILGYSLYDTVVVFDKVRENTRNLTGQTSRTYSEAANLAVNQVVVRSVNTTIIGVLPVAALLVAGVFILGEGPLKDLALALFVGMIAGAYSSLAIAAPLLVRMVEVNPDIKRHNLRVAKRREGRSAEPGKDSEKELVTAGAVSGRELKPSGSRRPQPARSSRAARKNRGRRR